MTKLVPKRPVKNPVTSGAVHDWLSAIAIKGGSVKSKAKGRVGGETMEERTAYYRELALKSVLKRGIVPKKDRAQAASVT